MATSASSATSSLGNSNVNINNLNIITFIKDIYLSLKHLDVCFSSFKTDIDAKMVKLEGQYETILERLSQLDSTLGQINDRVNQSSNMDSTIEKELLDKMYKLSSATEDAARLELKPKELTLANILENGYTMLDINNSLANNVDKDVITNSINSTNNPRLITGYKPFEPCDMSDNINSLSLELSSLENDKGQEKVKEKKQNQTLDSLLFD